MVLLFSVSPNTRQELKFLAKSLSPLKWTIIFI